MSASGESFFRQASVLLNRTPPDYTAAVPLLKQAAEAGHPEALYLLGVCRLQGLGVPADAARALDCFRQAAEQGHRPGRFRLAAVREQNGAPPETFLPVYAELARAGFLPAQLRLMDYLAEQNSPWALRWARLAARQNNPHALFFIAQHYQRGCKPDQTLAHRYYRQAAELGLAAAHWQLAEQYLHAKGVAQDRTLALYHLKTAAEAGISAAQNCYAEQLLAVKPADTSVIREALGHYHAAARQDNSDAHAALAGFSLTGEYLPRDYAAALRHAEAAARRNHPAALRLLGDIHRYGLGVPESAETAHGYYTRAARHGDTAARRKIMLGDALGAYPVPAGSAETLEKQRLAEQNYQAAYASHYGHGQPQDYARALSLYQAAAELGHIKAQTNLGMMHFNGQGTSTNPAEAARWFTCAARQGDPVSAYNLACLCYHGHGLPRDVQAACRWLEQAVANGHEAPEALDSLLRKWRHAGS